MADYSARHQIRMNKALKAFEKAREKKLVDKFDEKLESRCQKMSIAEKNMKKL